MKNNEGNIWDIILDGVVEKIGSEINKRILDAIPCVFDWLEKKGAEQYKKLKSRQASTQKYNDSVNLEIALKKYKSNVNSKEAQEVLIKSLSDEILEDSWIWESLSLFTQEIECPYCNERIVENFYDYVVGESSSERNMGTETIYSIECDELQCHKCKKIFSLNGFIEAYPDGIYNYHNIKTEVI